MAPFHNGPNTQKQLSRQRSQSRHDQYSLSKTSRVVYLSRDQKSSKKRSISPPLARASESKHRVHESRRRTKSKSLNSPDPPKAVKKKKLNSPCRQQTKYSPECKVAAEEFQDSVDPQQISQNQSCDMMDIPHDESIKQPSSSPHHSSSHCGSSHRNSPYRSSVGRKHRPRDRDGHSLSKLKRRKREHPVYLFDPVPPQSVCEQPPSPLSLPMSCAMLRIVIMIGFVSGAIVPSSETTVQPRFALDCPIHSCVLVRVLKQYYIRVRKVPHCLLSFIDSNLISTQIKALANTIFDPFTNEMDPVFKIQELSQNEVIVETFDFLRCDHLIRVALRKDHPSGSRSMWDPNNVSTRTIITSDTFPLGYGVGLIHPELPTQQERPLTVPSKYSVLPSAHITQPAPSLLYPPPVLEPPPFFPQVLPNDSEDFSKPDKINLDDLLNAPSAKEQQLIESGSELRELLTAPTAKYSMTAKTFQSLGGSKVQEICKHGTRQECLQYAITLFEQKRAHMPPNMPFHLSAPTVCSKIHFRRILLPHTDVSLGDCSYLDTCRHMGTCRFVHYEVDFATGSKAQQSALIERMEKPKDQTFTIGTVMSSQVKEEPAQWITCDIRKFDWTIFRGKIKIVMADPPWDIHMDLPYGTMTDAEMKSLGIDEVQDEGLLFLWVTGRAMELGRECMKLWGYKQIEELLWVKTNQLNRIIRTGRTGHWLNHSKEHCLVGIKGNPSLNRHVDSDVIVAKVRETSRKPDEIYRIIERLSPGPYKLELFGRQHNVRNNWITLGNQLEGTRLHDQTIIQNFNTFVKTSNLAMYTTYEAKTQETQNQHNSRQSSPGKAI